MYNAVENIDKFSLMGMLLIATLVTLLVVMTFLHDRDNNQRIERSLESISHELGGKK